jgi:hypothetical protein
MHRIVWVEVANGKEALKKALKNAKEKSGWMALTRVSCMETA